jgi:hypothetical protein
MYLRSNPSVGSHDDEKRAGRNERIKTLRISPASKEINGKIFVKKKEAEQMKISE